MLNKLQFHESCNNDVLLIAKKLNTLGQNTLNAFQDQLMEVYQLIYENSNIGSSLPNHSIDDYLKFRDIKYIRIQRFDCYVIYRVMPHAVVIVLGIIQQHRQWR